MRYQIEVTKMGWRLAGSAVSWSGLGMAVSKVVRKSGAIPSSRTAYGKAVTSVAKSGTRIKTYKTPTTRPKTPGAMYEPKSATAVATSVAVKGADREEVISKRRGV